MENLLKDAQLLSAINYANWALGLALLIIYTLIFQVLFRKFALVASNRDVFASNFMFFAVAIYLIITTIKSSLALSLGLVGALSIIRFRTAIKEPEQIIFLLALTAIAISLAAEQYIVSTISVLVFSIISATRNKFLSSKNRLHNDFLMITFNENDHQKAQNCIQSLSGLEEISSIHNYDFNGGSQYRVLFKLENSNLEIVPKIHTTFQNNQISEPNIRISGGNA
jgi:hypothetical protein